MELCNVGVSVHDSVVKRQRRKSMPSSSCTDCSLYSPILWQHATHDASWDGYAFVYTAQQWAQHARSKVVLVALPHPAALSEVVRGDVHLVLLLLLLTLVARVGHGAVWHASLARGR